MSEYKKFLDKKLNEAKVPSEIGKLLPASTKVKSVDVVESFPVGNETIVTLGEVELLPNTLMKLIKSPKFVIITTKKEYMGVKNPNSNMMISFKEE